MRVFILCTGRNGSTSIINACKYIENFSAGHETLSSYYGKRRFDYPDNHIEADNRLSWHLGGLDQEFGDGPLYVHLTRDRDTTAESFMNRFFIQGSMVDAFASGIRMTPVEKMDEEQRLQVCYDLIDTMTLNIDSFLNTKSRVLQIQLENIKEGFAKLWEEIGAKGDFEKAIESFDSKHNQSKKRSLDTKARLSLIAKREWKHIQLSLQKKD